MTLESNNNAIEDNPDSLANILISPNSYVPEELIEWIETEKEYSQATVKIDAWADMSKLWIDVSWTNNKLWKKIKHNNDSNRELLNWQTWEVPIEIYKDFNQNIQNIILDNQKSTESIQVSLLEDAENIFSEKSEALPVYVKISLSHEKAHIDNKWESYRTDLEYDIENSTFSKKSIYWLNLKDLSKTIFQWEYMKEVESLVQNSNWTMDSFINWLNQKWYKEVDLLKTMAALSAESFIRTYDNDFYENWDYSSAKDVLWQESNWNQLISNLQTSINTWKHIDTLTCIQYSTIIAQVLKNQWYDIVETWTIDVWVQHRFTALRWKDWLTHIISDWQIFSWENYNQAYTNYQGEQRSITFQSDMFDSDNNHLGSYQTETMKYLWNIVSANWSLNSQNLAKNISENWIDNRNKLEIEIWNTNKKLWITSIDKNWNWYNLSVSQKDITNEWTKVTSAQAWLSQIYQTWENSNIEFSQQLSVSQTKFLSWSKVNTAWLSAEMTTFNWFNQNKNWNVIDKWLYWNVATATAINISGIIDDFWDRMPVSNLELTSAIAWTIWHKSENLNIYLNTSISWQMLNMSSTSNVWNGEFEIDWWSIWAWWKYYIDWIWEISAKADYREYRWNNEVTVWWWLQNEDFQIMVEHKKIDYDFQIAQSKKSNQASMWYKIWDTNIPFIDTTLKDWVVSVGYKSGKIWNKKNSDVWNVSINFTF